MTIKFLCDSCGAALGADASFAGKVIDCPICGGLAEVTAPIPRKPVIRPMFGAVGRSCAELYVGVGSAIGRRLSRISPKQWTDLACVVGLTFTIFLIFGVIANIANDEGGDEGGASSSWGSSYASSSSSSGARWNFWIPSGRLPRTTGPRGGKYHISSGGRKVYDRPSHSRSYSSSRRR